MTEREREKRKRTDGEELSYNKKFGRDWKSQNTLIMKTFLFGIFREEKS